MYFHKTPGLLKLLYPTLVWEKNLGNGRELYLTFDDGPVAGVTEFVLDILGQYNAKATFFCVGENMKKNPQILQKIIQGGHAIGNHTQHHLNGWKTDDKIYLKDIEACNEVLDASLGKNRKKIFRPPYGKIKRSQIKEIIKQQDIYMWDVLSGDFDQKLNKYTCLKKTIENTKSGSIITFHDSLKTENKLDYVLPLYLEHFSKLGYKFLPL